MKQITLVLLLTIICFNIYCQEKKIFTKTTNSWCEMDFNGNVTSLIYHSSQKFEIFFNQTTNNGYIIVTEYDTNEKWKMDLNSMYTRMVNNDKVYFFQSSDGAFKISTQSNLNGICICGYKSRKCTNFFYQ